jgi:dTDP-4-dehydrorhamnose reductase
MKVIIFGSNGMLGRYAVSEIEKEVEVVKLCRNDFDLINVESLYDFLGSLKINERDILLNCAGLMKERIRERGLHETIAVNSLVPHMLQSYCEKCNAKLIHISTDCVFNGKKGDYVESDEPDGTSLDGKTKSLGEPETATVIRTSFIGEENHNKRSLLEWVRSQKIEIKGYTDHYWNGLTSLKLAKIICDIILTGKTWNGVRHIFTPGRVSKYALVKMINEVYELNLDVVECRAGFCDRSLSTCYDLNFSIPDIKSQIIEMKKHII